MRIWLALSTSSSDDSSVSSWFVRLRLGVLPVYWYSCKDGVSPLSMLSRERRRTPQLKLSMLSPCRSTETIVVRYKRTISIRFHKKRNTCNVLPFHKKRLLVLHDLGNVYDCDYFKTDYHKTELLGNIKNPRSEICTGDAV